MGSRILSGLFLGLISFQLNAQSPAKVKDFRGSAQSLALIGATSEFVDSAIRDQVLQAFRRYLNKYTRSYGEDSISGFKLNSNPNNQFFRPVGSEAMGSQQKDFLKLAAKDNGIDLFALVELRDVGDNSIEVTAQLYDSRIETLSGVEKTTLPRPGQTANLEGLSYRLMNYLDREGFVHPEVQNFLEAPVQSGTAFGRRAELPSSELQSYSVNPQDLSSGRLAGGVNIGGDKTPFWEQRWFWGLLGGGLIMAGGLSYYFLVVDQDASQGQVTFRFQN